MPYRKSLNFTFDGLKSAADGHRPAAQFQAAAGNGPATPEGVNEQLAARTAAAQAHFADSLDDDLNTAEALAAVFEYVRDANSAMDSGEFRAGNARRGARSSGRFDAVFDVLKPTARRPARLRDAEIEALIAERAAAKKAANFARADQIRDQLLEQGIILEDTKSGVRWKRKYDQ